MAIIQEKAFSKKLERKIILYLVNVDNCHSKFNQLKDLMDYFKYKKIDFAIIDIEEEQLKQFKNTPLATLLSNFKIPYFPSFIPEHTKRYFSRVIQKKEEQIKNFKEKLDKLDDKNSSKGNSFKFWIELYTKELIENRDFFNLKIKPQYLAETMLKKIEESKEHVITFIHLGIENTFPEITKILKEVNPNMDISYLHYLC